MLVKFEIFRGEKMWCARALGESIFTQGKTLDELMTNISDATLLHFEGRIPKKEPINILTLSESTIKYAKAATS